MNLFQKIKSLFSAKKKENKLVSYARDELERAGLLNKDSVYDGEIGKAVLVLVEEFSKQGHSGGSAKITIDLLKNLLNFKPITPLLGTDDEWVPVHYSHNYGQTYQNKRCSSVFKDNDGVTDIDSARAVWPNGSITFGSNCRPYIGITFPYTPGNVKYIKVNEEGEEIKE